jgi:hypothetical protein
MEVVDLEPSPYKREGCFNDGILESPTRRNLRNLLFQIIYGEFDRRNVSRVGSAVESIDHFPEERREPRFVSLTVGSDSHVQ